VKTWDTWYRGRSVLVVGGLGFVGINLSRRLLGLGATIRIVTPRRAAHDAEAVGLESLGARILEADVREAGPMREAVAGSDVVFNLAGRSGAVRSLEDPFTDLDVNCRGALVLLEAMRTASPLAKLVFPGSRLEYGRVDAVPVSEDAPMSPLCMHAVHKRAVEQYIAIYRQLYGLRSTVVRLTNPYGAGQPAGRVAYGIINRMIELALENHPLPVYGDGAQRRDYIYIDDVVDALTGIGASTVTDGQVYNLGSGVGTSFVDMARTVVELVGSGRVVFEPWPALAGQIETGDFVADISRLASALGWQPTTPLVDGLRKTIDGCRSVRLQADPAGTSG
jgi:nucleoside-diphosphate-sugar epimerase